MANDAPLPHRRLAKNHAFSRFEENLPGIGTNQKQPISLCFSVGRVKNPEYHGKMSRFTLLWEPVEAVRAN